MKERILATLVAAMLPASVPAATPAGPEERPAAEATVAPPPATAAPATLAPAERVAPGADGRRTMRRLPANLGWTAIGVIHADNLTPFIGGGAAAATASFWDKEVREAAQPHDWGETLETGAGPIWSSVFVAGMFTAGRFSHGPRFRAMTYDMLDAAIVNFAYTELVKVAVGRERPNGQDHKSFPSGHTSNAFALATVAEQHYGWKLGVPAYLVAGLVGASRIQQDKHFLSDVVAGATLGYVVGRSVVRVNSRAFGDAPRKASLHVAPIVGRRVKGLQVTLSY